LTLPWLDAVAGAGYVAVVQDDARSVEAAAILRSLGAEVRRRRGALGWARRELAERTGISERFLADVESGRANPSVSKLVQLGAALGCRASELIDGLGAAPRSVSLLGLRGAGKSTVGPALAAALEWPFVELDARIEAQSGLSLDEIFQVHGEAYYRRVENQVLREVLSEPRPAVVACGGGVVTSEESFGLLRARTHTVWLRARAEDHWRRVIAQGDTRPMADNAQAFQDLSSILEQRERLYRAAALCVDTSQHGVEEAVRLIRAQLGVG